MLEINILLFLILDIYIKLILILLKIFIRRNNFKIKLIHLITMKVKVESFNIIDDN
jgi:hypothetical protein